MALAHVLCCARRRTATERLSRPRGDGLALGIRPSSCNGVEPVRPSRMSTESVLIRPGCFTRHVSATLTRSRRSVLKFANRAAFSFGTRPRANYAFWVATPTRQVSV